MSDEHAYVLIYEGTKKNAKALEDAFSSVTFCGEMVYLSTPAKDGECQICYQMDNTESEE